MTVASPTTSASAISAFGHPARQQLEHLALALGQLGERRRPVADRCGQAPRDPVEQLAGDGRGQQRIAGGDHADRADELLGRDVLGDEAAGAGAQRLDDVLVETERRQHQHAVVRAAAGSPRSRRGSASGRPSARRPGGARAPPRPPRARRAASATTSISPVASSTARKPGPHQRLVVGDQHAKLGHAAHAGPGGRRGRGSPVQPSGRAPAVSSPPNIATRSRIPTRP